MCELCRNKEKINKNLDDILQGSAEGNEFINKVVSVFPYMKRDIQAGFLYKFIFSLSQPHFNFKPPVIEVEPPFKKRFYLFEEYEEKYDIEDILVEETEEEEKINVRHVLKFRGQTCDESVLFDAIKTMTGIYWLTDEEYGYVPFIHYE